MDTLKVGVIGLGHLGKFHVEKLSQISKAEITALVDIVPERLYEALGKIKGYPKRPYLTTDYKEIVDLVDAVIIVTPTITHYEIAKFFLEREKAVFVEKPLTHEFSLAEELVEISFKKKLPLQIGYIERFQEPVKEGLKKIKNPLFIEAHRLSSFHERNLDIDVILDLMIHDLDLIFLFKPGKKVDFIHAVGAPFFTKVPDIVSVRLVLDDGTTCNLTASRLSLNKQRRIRFFEVGNYFVIDTLERSFLHVKVDPVTREYHQEKKIFEEGDPLKEEVESFVENVLSNKPVYPDGKEALASLEVAFKIRAQVESNLKKFL